MSQQNSSCLNRTHLNLTIGHRGNLAPSVVSLRCAVPSILRGALVHAANVAADASPRKDADEDEAATDHGAANVSGSRAEG